MQDLFYSTSLRTSTRRLPNNSRIIESMLSKPLPRQVLLAFQRCRYRRVIWHSLSGFLILHRLVVSLQEHGWLDQSSAFQSMVSCQHMKGSALRKVIQLLLYEFHSIELFHFWWFLSSPESIYQQLVCHIECIHGSVLPVMRRWFSRQHLLWQSKVIGWWLFVASHLQQGVDQFHCEDLCRVWFCRLCVIYLMTRYSCLSTILRLDLSLNQHRPIS